MSIEPESNGNNQGDAIYFLSVPIGQVDVPFCLVGGYDAALYTALTAARSVGAITPNSFTSSGSSIQINVLETSGT